MALSYAASSRLGLAWARRQHFSENSDMEVFRGELETKGVSGPDAVSEILVSLVRTEVLRLIGFECLPPSWAHRAHGAL